MTLEEFEAIKKDDWCLVKDFINGLQLVKYHSPVTKDFDDPQKNVGLHNILTDQGHRITNEMWFIEHIGKFDLTFPEAYEKWPEYLI